MSDITAADASGRIAYSDFLKCIGLTGIIIAHVGPPSWLFMARNFDVQLMVILSSILGAASFSRYKGTGRGLPAYYCRRIKRIVIPTWLFLIIYFGLDYLVTKKTNTPAYYIASFSLTRYGINYVWIMLMYLYSALMIPLYSRIGFSFRTSLCLVLAYLFYEIAYYYHLGTDNRFVDTTFYYIIPYGGVLTYLGYNYSRIKRKGIIVAAAFSAFAVLGIFYWVKFGAPQNVQITKYPPRCYYLSYGIAVSFLLLMICEKHDCKIYHNPIVVFISGHSMWIYLWHVLLLTVYNYTGLPQQWYIRLAVVYLCSMLTVYLVNRLLDLTERRVKLFFFDYFRG